MTRSVRFSFRFFGRLCKQQRAVDSVSQGNSCGNIAFQRGYNASNLAGFAGSIGNNGCNAQGYSNNSIQVGKAGCVLEIGNAEGNGGKLNAQVAQSNYHSIHSINVR